MLLEMVFFTTIKSEIIRFEVVKMKNKILALFSNRFKLIFSMRHHFEFIELIILIIKAGLNTYGISIVSR